MYYTRISNLCSYYPSRKPKFNRLNSSSIYNFSTQIVILNILLFIIVTIFLFYPYNRKYQQHAKRRITKKNILVVVVSCPKDYKSINLNISKFVVDVEVLLCKRDTNLYDAREAGLMLDFIIKKYNNIEYNRVIFIHDHDTSPHYPSSITERINKISHEKYIYANNFIGVNCKYIQFNVGNIYEYVFHEVEKIDKFYLSKIGIDHVKMSEVHDNKYKFPCCASFLINTELFLLHPLSYYITLRTALKNFTLYGAKEFISKDYSKIEYRNSIAGGYMEFTWSTMFGQKNVSIPPDC